MVKDYVSITSQNLQSEDLDLEAPNKSCNAAAKYKGHIDARVGTNVILIERRT